MKCKLFRQVLLALRPCLMCLQIEGESGSAFCLGMRTKHLGTLSKSMGTRSKHLGMRQKRLGALSTSMGTLSKRLGMRQKRLGALSTSMGTLSKRLGMRQKRLVTLSKCSFGFC